MKIAFFTSDVKVYRFLFRWSLGLGTGVGIISILVAQSLILQIVQVAIGLIFYIGISIKRIRSGLSDWDVLCETCTFTRSGNCPGMEPLFAWRS
jgi:hypothetical protein